MDGWRHIPVYVGLGNTALSSMSSMEQRGNSYHNRPVLHKSAVDCKKTPFAIYCIVFLASNSLFVFPRIVFTC